ncbi:MAG: hypothetical protein ACK2VD_21295 [Anaerolineae bacterium]
METFIEPRELVENPHYARQRRKAVHGLHDGMIDAPIVELVRRLNELPHCFTLQSCYGHFLYEGQDDPHHLGALPVTGAIARVEYRIAYLAFCVANSASGRELLAALQGITMIDPSNVQFGCATWFWERQINSYVLQVEPDRFMYQDRAMLDYGEALHIEATRDAFLARLRELLQNPS